MPIPESQLSRWSDHGDQGPSKRTHEATRQVRELDFPGDKTPSCVLQRLGAKEDDSEV